MRLKEKIVIGATLLAAVPVLVASLVIKTVATSKSHDALEQAAMERLVALRDTSRTRVEDYYWNVRNQVLNLAESTTAIEALDNFRDAAGAYRKELLQPDIGKFRSELADYYSKDFLQAYQSRNPGAQVDVKALMSGLDDDAVALQYHYIKNSAHPLGEKDELLDPIDGSQYGQWHYQYHPFLRDFQRRFGYHDLLLVDARSGRIVYSVFKELDFATSLIDGPYAQSAIGEVFREAIQADSPDLVALSDFASYVPSYQRPAAFFAAPIRDAGEKIGVLILHLPIDRINDIMMHSGNWAESGLGTSGETYLVGADKRARSLSRLLAEDKTAYLEALRAMGESEQTLDLIAARDSNVGLQTIDTPSSRAALAGNSGFEIFSDYRNDAVLSAYAPVSVGGMNWAILAEVAVDEAFQASDSLSSQILGFTAAVAAVLILLAIGAGVWFANSLSRPIIRLSDTIKSVEGSSDLTKSVDIQSRDELGVAAQAFNAMLAKFRSSVQQVSGATSQLAATAEQTSEITEQTSQAIQGQLAETAQVATAMHEMSATVQEVARHTTDTAHATADANEKSACGQQAMGETIAQINRLSSELENASAVILQLEKYSEEIGSVLDVINGIAEQTNLLALNAAIEAARAGEQGRGFSVVADEVRNLASKTQASTLEINQMIDKLQSGSRQSVQAMSHSKEMAAGAVEQAMKTGQALSVITDNIRRINDMSAQIASASEEQGSVAEEISRNVISINYKAEQTALGAQQTAGASNDLSRLSSQLQKLVSQFKV